MVTIPKLRKLISKRLKFAQNNVYYCPLCNLWVKRLKKHHIHKSPSVKIGICKDCEKKIHDLEIDSDVVLESEEDPHSANAIFKKLGFKADDIKHLESSNLFKAQKNNINTV